jgi:hypothetical protein
MKTRYLEAQALDATNPPAGIDPNDFAECIFV